MANPINFIVTSAGRDAIYDAGSKGIKLSLLKIGLGTGQYQPAASRSALASEFTQNTIAAGGVELESFAVRFTVIMNFGIEKNVSELGIYTDKNVLFAVASLPAGSYFRLYPGINFVASMGLLLDTELEANSIEIALDGTAGQALQIMNAHVTEADPHPQYRDFSRQVMQEHLEAEDPHPQYALKSFLSDLLNELDDKIESLLGVTEFFFPNRLVCGYDVVESVVTGRKKGAIFSLADTAQVYLFCPEAVHEAWSTSREAEKITTSVYSRSGTGRGGYSGRSNYALIDTAQTLNKSGFGEESKQLANLIKAGTIEAGQSATIQKLAAETLKYNSSEVAVLISPEGAHEGWSISRTEDKITIDVFNRSGTNRTGYSGRINWALFKVNDSPLQGQTQYPINLTAGVSESSSFTIPAPPGHDFTDPLYFPIITPEGQNEGWSITRTTAGFAVNIFNRSGGNRVGYSGKVSWAVFLIDQG